MVKVRKGRGSGEMGRREEDRSILDKNRNKRDPLTSGLPRAARMGAGGGRGS